MNRWVILYRGVQGIAIFVALLGIFVPDIPMPIRMLAGGLSVAGLIYGHVEAKKESDKS